MCIDTNLGVSFSNYNSLYCFMIEENIKEVIITVSYWGARLPPEKLTIEEVKLLIE